MYSTPFSTDSLTCVGVHSPSFAVAAALELITAIVSATAARTLSARTSLTGRVSLLSNILDPRLSVVSEPRTARTRGDPIETSVAYDTCPAENLRPQRSDKV